jgi:hypothetical protein
MLPTRVALGGRLYTAESSQDKSKEEITTQKRQLKYSMGVNVMTPFGGGGFEGHRLRGQENSGAIRASNTTRELSITAQGGNSLISWRFVLPQI